MPKKTKVKAKKIKKGKAPKAAAKIERATIISSEVVYQGPLFRILHDKLIEPGRHNERDDSLATRKCWTFSARTTEEQKNLWIVMERQNGTRRNQYLWELPAGKLEAGEDALAGAKRGNLLATGYHAKVESAGGSTCEPGLC